MTVTTTLIELDGRLSLEKVGRHSRYLGREEADGTLIFEPAVVLTEHEARLMARPDLVERITENIAHPERRRPRRPRR